MKTDRILAILIMAFLFVASGPGLASTSADEAGCSLVIRLTDGSRIFGKSLDAAWQFHSTTQGDLKPNVAGIRSIEMAADGETAQLTGANHEQLRVRFVAATLPVDTSFGKIDVPVKFIRSIKVLAMGSLKTPPAGLVALWPAEGDGADSIGDNNAIPQGNVTFEPGLVGRAFGLDGHSAYLTVPASSVLDVGAGDGLTITAWIRPSAFGESPGNGARGPIIEWDSDNSDGVSLWANGGNSLSASLKVPTADGKSTGLQTANGALHSGEWQFVALTYDKNSGGATLYIDGVAVKSDNFGSVRPETTYPINIGRRTGQPIGNGESFGGLVDELALYNRALTAAELQDIYKAVAPPKLPNVVRKSQPQRDAPKLIGWWPLNEGEGTAVHDHSSRQPPHDGQMLGGISEPSDGLKPIEDQKFWYNTEKGRESLSCDGQHYVSLGNIYQGSYQEFTIACWIKHESSGWQDVVERGTWDQGDGIGLCMDYNGSSVSFGHYPEAVKSKAVVQDNRWHHVAGTMRRDGNDYVYSTYVDGQLDNTAIGCSRGMSATTGKWSIGARDGGSWSYRGLVNDVRFYDGALTEEAIKAIYEEKKIQTQEHADTPPAEVYDADEPAKAGAPDPIDKLVAKLSATTEWENGAFKPIELPESATAEQLVGRFFQTSSPIMANFELIEVQKVEIPTGHPKNYLAALCQTGAARKIVLLQFQNGGWWNRVYDSDEPAKAGAPDPIDRLVAKLSATQGMWRNGRFRDLKMPESTSPEKIVEQVFKVTGFDNGHVKEYKILQSRSVQIDGQSYTAAQAQTDLGKKVVLFTAGGAWNRVYDADEPAKNEQPVVTEPAKPLSQEEISRVLEQIRHGGNVDLKTLHRALISDQTALRAGAARILGEVGDSTSVPHLIDALSDQSVHDANYPAAGMATTRYWANAALKKLTKQDFGFVWNAPEPERQAAINRWKQYAKTTTAGTSGKPEALETNFQKVRKGMSREEIERMLGKPAFQGTLKPKGKEVWVAVWTKEPDSEGQKQRLTVEYGEDDKANKVMQDDWGADEPAKKDPPLSKEAQAVLDGLNLKAADPAWQSEFDRIERPETRPPNTGVTGGEVEAFLSDSRKRLKNLGVSFVWNATTKRHEVVAEAKDYQLAAKAEVVVRAKLQSTDGEADKYARFRVRVLEVLKNSQGAKLADELLVAAYSGKLGVPDGESTLYLERYNQQSDTGMWKLVGGEASSGVSHSTALAAAVQAAKSQPPIVDLGRVEMVDGSPSTFNLGGGRVCTITPTVGFDAVNSYDLVLLDGTEKISAPRQTAVVGQPVHISIGQTEVIFVPDVKSKR